jgi:hypothetical protein
VRNTSIALAIFGVQTNPDRLSTASIMRAQLTRPGFVLLPVRQESLDKEERKQ